MIKNRSKKRMISNLILLVLEKSIDGYVRLEDFAYNTHHYAYGSGWEYPLKKSELARVLKTLRGKGLIELTGDKELIYRLTDPGRDKALWVKMKILDEKWDGKWRVVIWDIPEQRKRVRDLLRYKLKTLGFEKLQKSVWVSKINCTKVLKEFIKKVGIEKWVLVLESDNIEN